MNKDTVKVVIGVLEQTKEKWTPKTGKDLYTYNSNCPLCIYYKYNCSICIGKDYCGSICNMWDSIQDNKKDKDTVNKFIYNSDRACGLFAYRILDKLIEQLRVYLEDDEIKNV